MKVRSAFYLATLLVAALVFVGCEAEEEPYVSPSGQEVAPDVVVNTPTDAVTVNLLFEDGVFGIELTSAFNWSTYADYNSSGSFYYTYKDVRYAFPYTERICDLGAMNGLGNITTFSTPNPAGECAVIKGHGYIFYWSIKLSGIYNTSNEYEVEDSVQQEAFNDYLNKHGLEYYCVWVKDVFENGITVQYVVRKTSVVTNS